MGVHFNPQCRLPCASLSAGEEAVICASCPKDQQSQVAEICKHNKIMKAFGGNVTSGADWLRQWEGQVVMAAVGLVQERDAKKARLIFIAGAERCQEQMSSQQRLISTICTELENPSFPIRMDWMPIEDLLVAFQSGKANAGGSAAAARVPASTLTAMAERRRSPPTASATTSAKNLPVFTSRDIRTAEEAPRYMEVDGFLQQVGAVTADVSMLSDTANTSVGPPRDHGEDVPPPPPPKAKTPFPTPKMPPVDCPPPQDITTWSQVFSVPPQAAPREHGEVVPPPPPPKARKLLLSQCPPLKSENLIWV